MPDRNPTLPPLPIATASKKLLHSTHALFCTIMPTSGEKGGGVLGGGGSRGVKCEMMMDDDEMNNFFTFFVQWQSESSRITQH